MASNRSSTWGRGPSALALAAALVLIGGCGGSGGEAPVASLTLGPLEPTVTAGGPAIQFTASLENASGAISWALEPQLGTLSATTGSAVTYTPPASLAEQAAVTLTASSGTLSVQTVITVLPTPSLKVSPETAVRLAGGPDVELTATLVNAAGPVSWSLSPAVGSLSAETGLAVVYTPPLDVPSEAVEVTVTATAGALSDTAVITVSPVPVLVVTPKTGTLNDGGPGVELTATLLGATDPIAWSLSPAIGTLSADTGTTTVYTPPATVSDQTSITITASAGELSDSAVITVLPCGTPGAGWLAWSSRAAGSYDVVVGKADGTCARPISSDPANDLGATFSAATGRVAWSSFRSGMQRIVIYDLATRLETVLDLGDLSAANPAFSPDGTKIAFEGRVGSGNADIYVVAASGGTPERVAWTFYTGGQPARDTGPAWVPPATPGAQSTQLYFVSDRLAAHHVYRINLDATGLTQITTTNPSGLGGILGKPSVSPDGSKVAFSRATASSGSRVVIRTLSTGAELVLAPVDEAEPAFSADGATVAVMSYAYGNPDVVTRSAANGALVERVTTSPASEGAPAFAR